MFRVASCVYMNRGVLTLELTPAYFRLNENDGRSAYC